MPSAPRTCPRCYRNHVRLPRHAEKTVRLRPSTGGQARQTPLVEHRQLDPLSVGRKPLAQITVVIPAAARSIRNRRRPEVAAHERLRLGHVQSAATTYRWISGRKRASNEPSAGRRLASRASPKWAVVPVEREPAQQRQALLLGRSPKVDLVAAALWPVNCGRAARRSPGSASVAAVETGCQIEPRRS